VQHFKNSGNWVRSGPIGGGRCGGVCRSIGGGNEVHIFSMSMFCMIGIALSEGFIHYRIREIVGAIGSAVVNKEMTTFKAATVVIKEFAFSVQEFWALFMWSKQSGGGGCSLRAIAGVIGNTMRGRFR
jgi:hypothetical protein